MEPTVIKGYGKWDDAVTAAASGETFIFIAGNGSKWAGEEEDNVDRLVEVLGQFTLDPSFERFGNFITYNPCTGVKNPEYRKVEGASEWVDGPRLFPVDGVFQFDGNFFDLSHGFNIYTNDAETIEKLTDAIRANQQTDAYQAAKSGRAA